MTDNSFLPMGTLLPPELRERLVAASKIESRIEFGESDRRAAVLAEIDADIRRTSPQYFNQEK